MYLATNIFELHLKTQLTVADNLDDVKIIFLSLIYRSMILCSFYFQGASYRTGTYKIIIHIHYITYYEYEF